MWYYVTNSLQEDDRQMNVAMKNMVLEAISKVERGLNSGDLTVVKPNLAFLLGVYSQTLTQQYLLEEVYLSIRDFDTKTRQEYLTIFKSLKEKLLRHFGA